MKIITIFILPHEVKLYEKLISSIKNEIKKFNLSDFYFDVTLSVCDEMVRWDESKTSKQEIIQQYHNINQNLKGDFNIDHSGEIMGCVSQRRNSHLKYPNAISFTWVDSDFTFPEGTFYIIDQSITSLNSLQDYFILTPQYVKMWDSTWDIICHPNFLDKPYNYNNTDTKKDAQIYGEITLQPLNKGIFKIGGGWITTISKKLLDLLPIPKSFGHYGEEDTFISTGSQILSSKGTHIIQYVISNLVVTQDNNIRDPNISLIDRRQEFRQIAQNNFNLEIKKVCKV
jgi:hypothetical protein